MNPGDPGKLHPLTPLTLTLLSVCPALMAQCSVTPDVPLALVHYYPPSTLTVVSSNQLCAINKLTVSQSMYM